MSSSFKIDICSINLKFMLIIRKHENIVNKFLFVSFKNKRGMSTINVIFYGTPAYQTEIALEVIVSIYYYNL